jgi:hypothetical protein
MQTVKSKRLTNDEREEISRSLAQKKAVPEIAKHWAGIAAQRFGKRSRGIAERQAIVHFLPVNEQNQGQGLAEKRKES